MMSYKYDFELVSGIDYIYNDIDLVVASEYFEHIYDCIQYIQYIIDEVDPLFLYIANSFNTYSIGYFNEYKNSINQKNISKIFNKVLIENNYEKLKTKLWNNKPTLWRKIV